VWIALDARDTKLAVGRELTKSNLLSALGKEKIRGLFCFNHDKGRSCLDLESEQAILIRKIRALNLADILHLRKLSMVPLCALNRTTRLEQFQLTGPLLKKSQKQLLPATQDGSLGKTRATIGIPLDTKNKTGGRRA
jgi:hypothetical protein